MRDDRPAPEEAYKGTVNLPQTDFPMRANAVEREPQIQQFWGDRRVYERLSQENPGPVFVLHDGPPYANGQLHVGHALNKILKDIINRYRLLRGDKVRYVLGWDCHGLPIELKVLQTLGREERERLTPLALRQKAQAFALATIAEQAAGFRRWGVWGDYENPYYTLQPEYEAAQIAVFGQMALKGFIYRGLKPVYWSPSSQTALAEAELEYPEGHVSPSIYVAFPVVTLGEKAQAVLGSPENLYAAIWTTTPWTIPANLGITANPELTYTVLQAGDRRYLVASDLAAALQSRMGEGTVGGPTFPGKVLAGTVCRHPLAGVDPCFDRPSPMVFGDYVTAESGTGLVHTAPAHGQDDFATGRKYDLGLISPVDERGVFTAETGPFAGLAVLKEGNQGVTAALRDQGLLLAQMDYTHKYPYDWRTKKPVIVRATEQWFASVAGFREAALAAIAQVHWIPASGANRIEAMVRERSDWCISRQRSWGVPIPVFYDEETGEALLTAETLSHIQEIFRVRGSDAWWELSVAELLPEPYRSNGRVYRKGTDTMDVWFDSGSSWAAVCAARGLNYPADLYLEGSDQHRGWFQSSLLTSVATNGRAPYRSVLTHGFVLDEKGQKMSKSLGNVVDPMVLVNGGKDKKQEPAYGADVLRLWVASVDYSADVPLGKTIVTQIADGARKIRNTVRFLLGNLFDFDPAQDAIAWADLPELDRYALHRLAEVSQAVTKAYDGYQFFRFYQEVQQFCTVDLSNFYLDIAKDRLYISAPKSHRRRSCQTVLHQCLEFLVRAIAPVLCHNAEDIWQYLPYPKSHDSVFAAGWFEAPPQWHQPELAVKWQALQRVRDDVNKALELARNDRAIGAPLEAKVVLTCSDPTLKEHLVSLGDRLHYLFITSQAVVAEVLPDSPHRVMGEPVQVAVLPAEGNKCVRCWHYSPKVGNNPEHPHLCERCTAAIAGLEFS